MAHSTPVTSRDRFRGALLGLAVGDALGAAVESMVRGTFPPVTDMTGGGPHGLRAGEWTDDTSMALCLAESLVEKEGFDAGDQMDRYLRWHREGYMSSTGACFGMGGTVRASLSRYEKGGSPYSGSTDAHSAGNGSIMRLAPVPLYFFPDRETAISQAVESSRTTHGTAECLDACRLLAEIVLRGLEGRSQADMLGSHVSSLYPSERIAAIAAGEYGRKGAGEIRGSAYVVESLEAALWCFGNTGSFEGAVLAAVNLGDDADTTAAVCGQVAGAFYGASAIPERWLAKLAMREFITATADRLREESHGM